jgi:uncharacterized protein YlaI
MVSVFRECGAKERIESDETARKRLRQMRSKGERGLHIYRCPHCHYLHIGHRPGTGVKEFGMI